MFRPMLPVAMLGVTMSVSADYPMQLHWSDTAREVWETVLSWNDAFEANDAETYFSFIDRNVVVLTPSSPYRIEYREPDRREFEFALERGYGTIQFFQELGPRIDIYGDTAIVTYYSRGLWGENATQMSNLKETNVLIKHADGWKIVHIHVSR
jgi:ketosteroid isomerase-like protein